MKIGIIGRADQTGLGIETMEFCRHFPCTEKMIVDFHDYFGRTKDKDLYKAHPGRLAGPQAKIVRGVPTDDQLKRFLSRIDVLFTIETPYNSQAYQIARQMGVKTVLRLNYEWLEPLGEPPDIFLAPSLYYYDEIPEPKQYLPFPIATDRLTGRIHNEAKHFIHIAGNRKAAYDRNGTNALLNALRFIKSDIRITIKSQVDFDNEVNDKRVTFDTRPVDNYWENYPDDADALILPRRYAGQSLPINEAMAKGMAIISTDMEPQNDFLHPAGLVPIRIGQNVKIKQHIDVAEIDPQELARTIDRIAGMDIEPLSRHSLAVANEWSWENLKPKYQKLFEKICQ